MRARAACHAHAWGRVLRAAFVRRPCKVGSQRVPQQEINCCFCGGCCTTSAAHRHSTATTPSRCRGGEGLPPFPPLPCASTQLPSCPRTYTWAINRWAPIGAALRSSIAGLRARPPRAEWVWQRQIYHQPPTTTTLNTSASQAYGGASSAMAAAAAARKAAAGCGLLLALLAAALRCAGGAADSPGKCGGKWLGGWVGGRVQPECSPPDDGSCSSTTQR